MSTEKLQLVPDAKATYEKYKQERQPYIDRGIENAKLTIPALFPKEGTTGSDKFKQAYQSVGARGINTLSAKLILALFPPNESFFRLGIDENALAQVGVDPSKKAELDQALMQIELLIRRFLEENQIRITLNEALLQLLVTGNCMVFIPPDTKGARLYSLKQYVMKRDAIGNVLVIVTLDKQAKMALPEEVQALVADAKPESDVEIYTKIVRNGDEYVSFQEVNGQIIQGSENSYPLDKLPYIPLRMTKQDTESYGRSYVEEYYGDLYSLDTISKALNFIGQLSAKALFLVNPNGVTRPKKLQDASSGDFVAGRVEDVQALQLNKYPDLNISFQWQQVLEQRLSYAFLLTTAVQRNAERVTAEEIRTVAQELENSIGGIYSILSQELQLPLIKVILNKLMRTGAVPQLPDGVLEPTITTGMEALGRGQDFNKYMTFVSTMAQLPEAMQYLKIGEFVTAIATSLGIETPELVKTQEELEQEQQQAMENQAGMEMVKGAIAQDG